MIARIKYLIHSAKTHQGFHRYFANTSWMFAEQILRMFAGLLVGIWVARYLGPEQFGVFSYAIVFGTLFSSIASLGLKGIVVRDLVKAPEQRDRYLGTSFWLKLCGALLMLAAVVLATLLTSIDSLTNLYILIIACGAIFQSFEVVDFYFQSKVLSKIVSVCKMTQILISTLLKLYFIFTEADLIWFVLVTLVDQFTLAISLYIAYRYQKLGSFYRHFDMTTAKQLLKDSWPLIFSGLMMAMYMRIDQIMIKEMLGVSEVGLFSAAVRLSEVCYFIPMIIASSLFPSIVNAKRNSQTIYLHRLQNLFTLMTWLAITIAIPMTFLSDLVVSLLYGDYYKGAGMVLAIHIWGAIFVFLGVASEAYFTIENYTNKSLYRTSLGASSNILLNFYLIPRYGINGAAMATLISQFITNLLFDFFDNSVRDLAFIKIKALFPIYYIWPQKDN